jgi:hypothetical protein
MASRLLPALVVAAFGVTACDRILGKEADADADAEVADAEAKSDEKQHVDEEQEAKIEADPEAARKAAEDAARKAEEEARRLAEAEAALPIQLGDIQVTARGGLFAAGSLELVASGKLNKTIDSGTYVRAKVVCKDGDRFMADVAWLSGDGVKPLQDHAVGETAEFRGSAFSQGVKEPMSPCQIDFKLAGGGSSTLAVDLRTACWDGTSTKIGPCDPPVAAAAMSAGGAPLEVHDLVMEKHSGYGGSGQLEARYVLAINKPQDQNSQITLKAACEVGDAKFVDMSHARFDSNPFTYESGESIARQASLFYNPAFGFVDAPGVCDLTVALWSPVSGSFGEQAKTTLARACYREGKMSSGRCDPAAPEPPPAAPVSADSLRIDTVAMQIVEPYGGTGDRFQLKIDADATVLKTVDQKASVQAKVTCKIGATARVETAYPYGVELHYLEPGETTRLSTTTFTSSPLEEKPRSCEAEFTAGERFAPSGATSVAFGKWCMKKDKVKACGGQPKSAKKTPT